MKRIYLIDLDGTAVKPGIPHEWMDGAVEKLKALSQLGQIWFFSCWAYSQADIEFLQTAGISFGCLSKPLAEEYVVIDNLLIPELCTREL